MAYNVLKILLLVQICRAALERQDEELLVENKGTDNTRRRIFLGRDKELAEVASLLKQDPTQIIVIAGESRESCSCICNTQIENA